MAKFPTYERRQGLAGGSTGSGANFKSFMAPGNALSQAGEALADVAGDFSAIEAKVRETQDNTWFSKARAQTAIDISSQEQELQKQATGGAPDFTPMVQGKFGEYRAAKEAEAPSPRARQMYQQWADSYGVDVTGRAAKFQAESELAKRTTDFSDAINAHAQAVYADPSQYDAVKKRMDSDFLAAKQWMTPEQEEIAKEKANKTLQLARAKNLSEFRPEQFMQETGRTTVTRAARVAPDVQTRGQQAMGFFMSKGYTKEQAAGIVGNLVAESNLRSDGPSGDNGTAHGLAQWRGERLTRLQRFANAQGKDWKDFGTQLAFVDMELQNHETGAYQKLKNAKTVDEATAAFIGYERPQGWSEGNPRGGHNYKGRLSNAAAFAGQEEIAFHEGGTFVDNPAYKDLTVDEIMSLQNRAESNIKVNETNLYNDMKGTMELGVKTGSIMSESDILNSGLRDDDKATLLTTFRSQNKEQLEINAALQGLSDKSLNVDPYDPKAKKALDGAYDAIISKATPEQKQAAGEEIVRQTGVVPERLMNEMRRDLGSTDPNVIAQAAQQASRISQINPAALSRRDGGAEVQKTADDFGYYVNNLNMTPEQAAQKIADNNNPDKVRERKALEPAAKEFNKLIAEEDVADVFDDRWLSDPAVGFNEGQRLGIQAEYQAIAEEQFFKANGDVEIAKNRAKEEMKRLYGVTDMTGSPVVMKHPPERYWPAINGSSPFQYAKTQLYADLYAIDPDVDMAKVQFVSTAETDAMVKRGEMPAYAVFYADKNGVLQTMPGKLWRPDASNQMLMQGERNAIEQGKQNEAARVQQDIHRTDAEMRADPLGARDASLDAFISGPEATPADAFKKNKGK